MATITAREMVNWICSQDSKTQIEVQFIKRSTGELRHMKCRYGVPSPKGGEPAYSFKEKKLICVYDVDKNEYRSIPIEGAVRIKINGEWMEVIRQ